MRESWIKRFWSFLTSNAYDDLPVSKTRIEPIIAPAKAVVKLCAYFRVGLHRNSRHGKDLGSKFYMQFVHGTLGLMSHEFVYVHHYKEGDKYIILMCPDRIDRSWRRHNIQFCKATGMCQISFQARPRTSQFLHTRNALATMRNDGVIEIVVEIVR